jgi:hypothetical protein
MRRAALLLLALASTALVPGCATWSVWEWADERERVDVATPAELVGWSRAEDDGFRFEVRDTDGAVTVVESSTPDAPAGLLWAARYGPPAQAAARVRLAVRRGLLSRAFATDADFARLSREPDFQAAAIAPLSTPTFSLGPLRQGERAVRLHADGEDFAPHVAVLHTRQRMEPHEGRTVVAVLTTPLTVAFDVVTGPFQAMYFLTVLMAVGDAVGGAGSHH